MRVAKILTLALVLTLALAGVASARVRHEARHVAGHAAAILALDQSGETPEAEPSEAPEAEPTKAPETEPSEAPETQAPEADGTASATDNHGAAVSAVAQDRSAVATKTLPNGKQVTNHGQAVSVVARSDAGKPAKAQKAGGPDKSAK